jgi:hypothetical protein
VDLRLRSRNVTAPTATADELRVAAIELRSDTSGLLDLAAKVGALAAQLPLMLEVVAAADKFAFAPEGAVANGDRHRALMDAVRALRGAQ